MDNSLDADGTEIRVKIWSEEKKIFLMISDNGIGMDFNTLDQALRLGSITQKNPVSDLGKFGMGLVTAGLSLARRTTVITKRNDIYLSSIVDIDEVVQRNQFCKFLGEATPKNIDFFNEVTSGADSGTVVLFEKCDGVRNKNTTVFANSLRKHLGRVHRYFLKANKSIFVNDVPTPVLDPLELNDPKTEVYSDEEYPISIKTENDEHTEMLRIRIALIPENYTGGEREIGLGIKNQGFYILRNNREIKAADTLDAFTKHNDFNRMRGEVFFTGALDELVGIDFTKREIVLEQSFKDQILKHIKAQCTTIKARESGRTKTKEDPEISSYHQQAEKNIDQKAKLLITPKTDIEKRQGPSRSDKERKREEKPERTRRNFEDFQKGIATRCKFEFAKLGPNGQIYECELQGRTVLIRWNVEHPFYQRFILDQRSDGRLVTAVDFLIYSMAAAELITLSEENLELLNNFKAVISANVRTLLS